MLPQNHIGARGAEALATMLPRGSLIELNLSHNHVCTADALDGPPDGPEQTEHGVQFLVEAVKLSRALQILDISENQLPPRLQARINRILQSRQIERASQRALRLVL